MANIRVTCPACKSELEIDEAFDGQEVECGNCLEVFTAKKPGEAGKSGTGKIPGAGTSRAGTSSTGSSRGKPAAKKRRDDDDDDDERDRRRRRDDDDDDDDDYAPPPPRRQGGGNGLAITSLILGITGFVPGCVCCWAGLPLSLIATLLGGIAMSTPNGKGMAIAGLILGICGTIFNIVKGLLTGGI